MKIIDCEQGDSLWTEARLSIPTASEFKKIITPKELKLSKQADKYAFRLIAQELLGYSLESLDGLEHIERGKELEPEAVRRYEFDNDAKTLKVGFITTDDGKAGCSPDRLVDDNGMVEIKCPAPQTFVGCIVNGIDDEYICQKQGQLYIAEREWADVFFYHPQFQPIQKRFYRDESFIAKLAEALQKFSEMKEKMMEKVKEHGFVPLSTSTKDIAERTYQDNIEQLSGETA
jgi:hypothetical protein